MTKDDILRWLKEHGGQKNMETKLIDETNPKYEGPGLGQSPTVKVKQVTWTAADGQTLTIYDRGERNQQSSDESTPETVDVTETYEVAGVGKEDKQDTRTPEKKQLDTEQANEAAWNRDNGPNNPNGSGRGSGLYETHDERLARESKIAAEGRAQRAEDRDIETRARNASNDAERNAVERDRVEIERKRAETAAKGEERQTAAQEAQNVIAQGQLDIAKEREEREGKKPTIIGTPTDEQERIAYIDPKTGEIKSDANPLYNQLKTESAKKREELKLAVETNKMKLDEATAEYNRWFDENVRTPLLLSQERRAQSTEQRQALQAEEQRRQFKATNELERGRLGQSAAETASANERALLPYRAGPQAGEQFSSAINSLAHGGTMDSNAAAGINFTADAFEFDAPNFKKIAKDATREALKHLTPYNPSEEAFGVADYTGIPLPNADTMGTAPGMPALLDTTNLVRQAIPSYDPRISAPIPRGA